MSGYKVLIVEDDLPSAELLKEILEQSNYQVFHTYDGRKAVDMVEQISPDIAIIDVMLPTLNGFEVCEQIHQIPAFATLPIIVLTVLSEPHHRLRALQAGAMDYITKPFDRMELLAKVHLLLGLQDEFAQRELFKDVIYCLLEALKGRNPETEAHCHRVAKLSEQIGIRLELSPSLLCEMKSGALLHDIGVLGSALENKDEIKHTLIGERMFSRFNRPVISSIIKYHHLKYCDEFPDNDLNDDIKTTIKIVALCNRFDRLAHTMVTENKTAYNILSILWNEVTAGYWDKHVMQELENYIVNSHSTSVNAIDCLPLNIISP